jgi:hypothetical protein
MVKDGDAQPISACRGKKKTRHREHADLGEDDAMRAISALP